MNNFWRKIIGHKFDNRYKWGEFYWRLHPKQWQLSLKLSDGYDDRGDTLILEPFIFSAFIHLPTKFCHGNRWDNDDKRYGFYVYQSLKNFECFVLCWSKWSKHIEMPWTYKWLSTEILDHNYNSIYYEDRYTNKKSERKLRWEKEEAAKRSSEKTYDYTYVKKSGEVQKRKATVIVERMVWTMRWLPIKKMIRTSIWVTFDEEIGEKVGSWKGGTTGCGWNIVDGDTPEITLRKMENERKFD